jgi:hypothetical protein
MATDTAFTMDTKEPPQFDGVSTMRDVVEHRQGHLTRAQEPMHGAALARGSG